MSSEMREYADRDHMELDRDGNYYCRHVSAMTREGLHAKSDIAAELAWRDREIDRLRALLARTEAGADGVCRQLVRDDHSFCAAAQQAREHIERTFAEKCAAGEFDAPEYHDTSRLDWLGEHLAGGISLRTIAGASYITADSPYELRYSIDEARREFGTEPTIVRDVLAEWRLKAAKYDLLCELAKFHGFNNACEAIDALTHPQDASGDAGFSAAELESLAKCVLASVTPGGFHIPEGWNVLLDKLAAMQAKEAK